MSGLDLSANRRLVVKVGSSLLIGDDGALNRRWLDSLADDVAERQRAGNELLIVSSGAIAIGSAVVGINRRRARLHELQAAAAAGQVQLVHAYQESLARHGCTAAQVLLIPEDTENRRRFLNARSTLSKLIGQRVVPVVNENDTVATEEIRYGDNDRLAARVAQLVMADVLILLSDVDGLYTADPAANADAQHIPEVAGVTAEVAALAGKTRSAYGTGGMTTKLEAARIATLAGCSTIIASGLVNHPLRALQDGARHTVFPAAISPAAVRKQWLAGVLKPQGELRLDDGAVTALRGGGSLLPVGVVAVEGSFRRGDVVRLANSNGVEIGRGLVEYADEEARRLMGCRSDRIEELIGYRGRSVIVHRDELVVFDHE